MSSGTQHDSGDVHYSIIIHFNFETLFYLNDFVCDVLFWTPDYTLINHNIKNTQRWSE